MKKLHQQKNRSTAFTFLIAAIPRLSAAGDITLDEVTITSAPATSAVMVSEPQPTPKSSVAQEGIELLGGPAQTSVYAPLDLVPSVNYESSDPYGLSPTRNINIRGKSDFHVTRNIEGLPVAGIVGGTDLIDLENVGRFDVYRGGMPANQGLGMSNATGAVDQQLLAPREKFGVIGKQALGSFGFLRSFLRLDTGKLSETGTSAFISGSTTATDKWKGEGDISRENAMLGLSQQLGDRLKIDIDFVYNQFAGHTYRPLTYNQVQDLHHFADYDYNANLSGNSAADANYYDVNRSEYENYATLAKIDFKLAEGQHLIVKPYYWDSDGVIYSANGSNVQIWHQKNDNLGGVLEYQGNFGTHTNLVVGYWAQSMAPPPPPTDQTLNRVNADGSLSFNRRSTLAKIDPFLVNSPYFQLTETFGHTVVSGGLRYMDLGVPEMQYYKTAGLPNVPYDQIWAYNPTPDANAATSEKNYGEFLPNFGVRQQFNAEWSASASYGRRFGRPDWGPQASNYISNEAAFVAKGMTLQNLVDRVKPELSDQLDLSVSYKNGGFNVVSTLFGAKNQNRQVMVTDSSLGGLSYYQGTAKTTQYGIEFEADYQLNESLSLFGSATLASETYDEDTPTLAGGRSLATKGKQIPNTASTLFKGGLNYRWHDLTLSPVVKNIGRRYGDSAETQIVNGYTVFDLNASYHIWHDIRLSMSLQNVFDRQYVSQISANDFNLNNATAYYVGAPRTLAFTLSGKF
ncbi:MAG: TonB-dependent receptor [Methylomonas sp.]|nr:TonB-dependent receptor [Methylomonas sp.]